MSDMFVRGPLEKSRSKGEGGVDLRGREIHFAIWTNTFCNMDKYMFVQGPPEKCGSKGKGGVGLQERTNRVGFSQVSTCEKSCVYEVNTRLFTNLQERKNRVGFSQVNTCEKPCTCEENTRL